MGLLTAVLSLVFCWESQTHTISALVLPSWPSKETRYTSILGHKDLCTSPTDSNNKERNEEKKKNVARKAAGLEFQELNWDCICKQQKQSKMQESCPGATGAGFRGGHKPCLEKGSEALLPPGSHSTPCTASLPQPACSKGSCSTDPTWLWHSVAPQCKG